MALDKKALQQGMAAKTQAVRDLLKPYEGKESETPAQVAEQSQRLLGEFDQLKAQYDLIDRLESGEDFLAGSTGPKAAPLSWRDAAPGEGDAPIDEKAWREFEIDVPGGKKSYRYHVPLAVEQAGKGYGGAFEGYLRKGFINLSDKDRKTLIEGTDSSGGFFVPPDYQLTVLKKTATMAVVRKLARVIQTSRDIVQFPRYVYTTDDKYTSPVRMTWTGESPASSTAHRVTDTVSGLLDVPVHTAMASWPISVNLIEDSAFDIYGMSSDFLAEAFALGEDDTFLNGTGVGQPMGLLTQVGGNGPAAVVSGASSAITTSGDSFSGYRQLKLFYTLPAQYRARASWIMNSNTMLEVESLVDTQDRPIISALLNASIAMGMPELIKGRPIFVDEFTPDIGADTYPEIFGDMNGYTVVDRVGFSVKRLDELYAETNLMMLLARKRVGGYCTEPYKIKVLKCSAS